MLSTKNLLSAGIAWLWNKVRAQMEDLYLPTACGIKGIVSELYLNGGTQAQFTLKYVASVF